MMKRREAGLSLIEVLFALGILAIVLAAVSGGLSSIISNITTTKEQGLAMDDAKKILEHVRMVADEKGLTGSNSVTDKNYWESPVSGWFTTETFSNLQNAKRSISFPEGTSGDPLHVKATVEWQEKNGMKTYSLDTLVTKRLDQS